MFVFILFIWLGSLGSDIPVFQTSKFKNRIANEIGRAYSYTQYLKLLVLGGRIIVRADFSHRSSAHTRAVTPHR